MQEGSVAADFIDSLWCAHLPHVQHRHQLHTVQHQRQNQRMSTIASVLTLIEITRGGGRGNMETLHAIFAARVFGRVDPPPPPLKFTSP